MGTPLLECPCGIITKVEGGVVRVTCKCGKTYKLCRAVEPIYVPQVENLKKGGIMETRDKCTYCNDPILDFQETDETGQYHIGCKRIKEQEE
ncbi:hypothetical protein LCGC14_3088030 [marine sediment metagenome]|uniref:Uncharacterized protein n=1 Tax=marine sediment metagenome TaxID=412755 RepID=A0A0F8Z1U5_9ZZZZ